MSRVAKNPVVVPAAVEIKINRASIEVKGALGVLTCVVSDQVEVTLNDNSLFFLPTNDSKFSSAMSGTLRSLLNNMVMGVSAGFEKKLLLVGVGYRAQVQGNVLNLSLGFSHTIAFVLPDGVTASTPSQTEVLLKGVDKQIVGQVASEIRAFRPPEPYKGKGIRYAEEVIQLKETKKK